MSVRLQYNLTGVAPGFTDKISWIKLMTPMQQLGYDPRPSGDQLAHLQFFNESGCVLQITSNTGRDTTIPAGGWPLWELSNGENSLTFTVDAVAPGALFSTLYMVLYQPGETIVSTPFLGNSPIGGSVATPSTPANAFEQDLFSPWVLEGLIPTPAGAPPNQVNTTSGIAFLRQPDSSLGRIAPVADSFLTTVPSTTYFLDLNPDGSFSFATTHSGMANYISIAQVTTDGSGNVSGVNDVRPLNTTMLALMLGTLIFPNSISLPGGGLMFGGGGQSGSEAALSYNAAANLTDYWTPQGGAAQSMVFICWDGATGRFPLALGSANPAGAPTYINNAGVFAEVAGQASAGAPGVPVIVARALHVAVTSTALQTILSFTPPVTGYYRVSGVISMINAGATRALTAIVNWVDPDGAGTLSTYMDANIANFSTTAPVILDGVNGITSGARTGLSTRPFYASSGGAMTCQYQDPTGTPNDHVTFFIEWLA